MGRMRSVSAAIAALFAVAFVTPAHAIRETTVYITGASVPAGQTVTYRVVDRMCAGLPYAVMVRGGDLSGVPFRICAAAQGGAIGIIKPDGSAGPGVLWLQDGARVDAVTGATERPAGWTPPVIRLAPRAAPRGTPSSTIDPSRFTGRWVGQVYEPAGMFKSYTAYATLQSNPDGTLTGSIQYSGYSCSGSWTAYASNQAPAGRLTLVESIDDQGKGCAPSGFIELAPRSDGRLDYSWRARQGGEILSSGVLRSQ